MDARDASSVPGPNGTLLAAPVPDLALKAALEDGYNGNTNVRTFTANDIGTLVTGFDIEARCWRPPGFFAALH